MLGPAASCSTAGLGGGGSGRLPPVWVSGSRADWQAASNNRQAHALTRVALRPFSNCRPHPASSRLSICPRHPAAPTAASIRVRPRPWATLGPDSPSPAPSPGARPLRPPRPPGNKDCFFVRQAACHVAPSQACRSGCVLHAVAGAKAVSSSGVGVEGQNASSSTGSITMKTVLALGI